jgi:hypothetical protein
VVALVEGLERGVEHAVDPVFREYLAVLRLDVDVGGPPLDRAEDQRVHEADDRALGRRGAVVDGLRLVVGHELEPQRLARLLEQDVAAAVALQERGDAVGGGDHRLDGPAEEELGVVHAREVVEVAEGEDEPSAVAPERDAAEADEHLEWSLAPKRRVVGHVIEGIVGEAEGLGPLPPARVLRPRGRGARASRAGRSEIGHRRDGSTRRIWRCNDGPEPAHSSRAVNPGRPWSDAASPLS